MYLLMLPRCSAYLAEWTSLASLLTSSQSTPRFGVSVPLTGNSTERAHLKEASTSFFDRLSELEGISSQYPLSRQDPEMRDRVGREVEELVAGAYGGFVGRCQGKGMEKCKCDFMKDCLRHRVRY